MSTPHNVSKPRTNRKTRNLLKTHFVNIKHIKMGRNIDEFFVSPTHSIQLSYEVLTRIRPNTSPLRQSYYTATKL